MLSALPTTSNTDSRQSSAILVERLSSVLPKDLRLVVYHLSTPPSKSTALFHPPPDARPDKTYCETHFLGLTLPRGPTRSLSPKASTDAALRDEVFVFALEIFIFTTAFSTIFFVSKADSTGYLHQGEGRPMVVSPVREVSSAFIAYLVEQRQRKDIPAIVSLFARAQAQYLFPGSVKNRGKHVLDDRGLVKWWCKVLDPLVSLPLGKKSPWEDVRGYLIVPGQDTYETRAFLPRNPSSLANWTLGHPLEKMSHYTREYDWVPPRCLIPKYPDDPKSRFRDELDRESSKWKEDMGSWKSVRTLDQFWEMMAFRQECSSGSLTGFIWVVYAPKSSVEPISQSTRETTPPLPTPNTSFDGSTMPALPATPPRRLAAPGMTTPKSSPLKRVETPGAAFSVPMRPNPKNPKKKVLTGPIVTRQAKIKTHQRNKLLDLPVSTPYYYWPAEGRGKSLVDETMYKRCTELLTNLDFSTFDKATNSTERWIREVGGSGPWWGLHVVGRREAPTQPLDGTRAKVNNLSGLIKRKRAPEVTAEGGANVASGSEEPPFKVNVLGAGLVRKKQKGNGETTSSSAVTDGSQETGDVVPKV